MKSLVGLPMLCLLLIVALASTSTLAADPAAQKAVNDARTDLAKSQATLKQIRDKASLEYETSDEFKTAQANLQKAQADYKAATTPVLEALKNKPEYKTAMEKKAKANAAYEAVSKPGSNATSEQISAASGALVTSTSELNAMEVAALADSPAVADAKAKQIAATEELKKIRGKFEATLKDNVEYQEQLKLVEADKQKLEMARKAVADAAAAAKGSRPGNAPARGAPPPRSTGAAGGRSY